MSSPVVELERVARAAHLRLQDEETDGYMGLRIRTDPYDVDSRG
jgi:hypothetical protein